MMTAGYDSSELLLQKNSGPVYHCTWTGINSCQQMHKQAQQKTMKKTRALRVS